ncbi:hypothetical protein Taro_018758 [Colocasia esculenta]|uniref:Uncharacterized protein n=1 Tax=Colocasia esculenta TaxID=4460 RepID=A0A843US77_COLES|nr:hypothetical protein [Colocasia esculenta]
MYGSKPRSRCTPVRVATESGQITTRTCTERDRLFRTGAEIATGFGKDRDRTALRSRRGLARIATELSGQALKSRRRNCCVQIATGKYVATRHQNAAYRAVALIESATESDRDLTCSWFFVQTYHVWTQGFEDEELRKKL